MFSCRTPAAAVPQVMHTGGSVSYGLTLWRTTGLRKLSLLAPPKAVSATAPAAYVSPFSFNATSGFRPQSEHNHLWSAPPSPRHACTPLHR